MGEAAGGDADGGDRPATVPRHLNLRPFRSHVCIVVAEVEFCMMCACKAPRYQVAQWRTGCCDGTTPIGAVPRHILAVVAAGRPAWPARQATRGHELEGAARAHNTTLQALALRRPKRRQARSHPLSGAASGLGLPSVVSGVVEGFARGRQPRNVRGDARCLSGPGLPTQAGSARSSVFSPAFRVEKGGRQVAGRIHRRA